jgi:hypothetical protein
VRTAFLILSVVILVCSAAYGAEKTVELLKAEDMDRSGVATNFFPPLTGHAKLTVAAPWMNVEFEPIEPGATEQRAYVVFEFNYSSAVQAFEWRQIPDGTASWPNVWLGYDAFSFDYQNPGPQPVKATVWIQDYASWLVDAKREYDPQKDVPVPCFTTPAYEQEVELAPGTGKIAIPLSKTMWTSNPRKGLALGDVRSFGMYLKSPVKKTEIAFTKFRLEAKDPKAGVFEFPAKVTCTKCASKFSDQYAPYCPFCGEEMKDCLPTPQAPPTASKTCIVLDAADGGGGAMNSGGGHNISSNPPEGMAISHYDMQYNDPKGKKPVARKSIPWDSRYYLKFKIDDLPKTAEEIKSATLRLFGSNDTYRNGFFNEKPWNAALVLYSVNSEFDNWDGRQLCWATMPPFEKVIFVGGQYPGPAAKHPVYKVSDKEGVKSLSADITEYVQEAKRAGRKTITIGMAVFTPFGAMKNPHALGHYLSMTPPAPIDPKSPKLSIEVAP